MVGRQRKFLKFGGLKILFWAIFKWIFWILGERGDNTIKILWYFSEKHAKMTQNMPKTMKNAKFVKIMKNMPSGISVNIKYPLYLTYCRSMKLVLAFFIVNGFVPYILVDEHNNRNFVHLPITIYLSIYWFW